MKEVLTRQHILIQQLLVNGQSVYEIKMLPDFSADEVIVRQICYGQAAGATSAYSVYWSEAKSFIGHFTNPTFATPQITLDVKQQSIGGIQKFIMYNQGLPISTLTGDLLIHLEFVKYK